MRQLQCTTGPVRPVVNVETAHSRPRIAATSPTPSASPANQHAQLAHGNLLFALRLQTLLANPAIRAAWAAVADNLPVARAAVPATSLTRFRELVNHPFPAMPGNTLPPVLRLPSMCQV